MRGPYGNGFDLDDYRGKDLIVVAGGTGLSPVRGVIDHFAMHPKERGTMTLICGFKTPQDILFRDDLKRWQQHLDLILTVDDATGDSTIREGLVTQYIPELTLNDSAHTAAIVVGPPAMMRFSVQALLAIGLPEENIWISHERKMCCGLGKCGHCRINSTYVCLNGPVFNFSQSKHLID